MREQLNLLIQILTQFPQAVLFSTRKVMGYRAINQELRIVSSVSFTGILLLAASVKETSDFPRIRR